MVSDLVQCTRCRKVTINEEYDSHRCVAEYKGSKTVNYSHYLMTKGESRKGINWISIIGLDGIRYEFNEVPENKDLTKIPYDINRKFTPSKNNRRFDRTCLSK